MPPATGLDVLVEAPSDLAGGTAAADNPRRTYITWRERQILILAANGNTNQAIGRALGVGEETVKTQMKRVLRKLRVSDRAQAVAVGARLGLFSLEDVVLPPGVNHLRVRGLFADMKELG
ncbi:MAG: LuxR C-terminal-related transcriptional regulator [Actinomycetes bacterium]